MIKRLTLTLALLLVVTTALASCTARQTEKVSLKIGSIPRTFDLIAYVAQQEGLFDRLGVAVEIVPFRSTIEMNTALLAGELDGIIQGVFEAVNLNKEKETAKLVGHALMPRVFVVVSSPKSNITSPAQLKGKEVAIGTGTIVDYAIDRLLMAEGIDPKDIVKVNVPSMPVRLEVLTQEKVPAAIFSPPLSDLAVLNGCKVVMDDGKQPLGGPGLLFAINALKNKPEAIKRFVQAWQQAVDMVNANPEKYRALFVDVAKVPEPLAKQLAVPTFPKLQLPAEAEVNAVVNWMAGKGLINKPLRLQDIVDTGFLK